MVAAQQIPLPGGWPPGTQFFSTDDARYFVVIEDNFQFPDRPNINVIRQPTVVMFTNEDARVADMNPDFTYPPETTVAEAVQLAGFDLTEGAP